jgi:two-component sensor histidine kinase
MKSWHSSIGWPLSIRRKSATEATPRQTSPDFTARPLRLRFLFWITIWLAPVAAISVIQGIDRVQRDVADVHERMIESARASAAQGESVFASGEQVLRALANQPQVRDGGSDCTKALADALKGVVYFNNLFRIDARGNVLCAANTAGGIEPNVASQSWWQQAIRQSGFSVTPQTFSSAVQQDVLRGVLPLMSAGGAFDGAVVVSLDVGWLDILLRNRPLPANTVLAVFDSAGSMVAANNQQDARQIFRVPPSGKQQEQLLSAQANGISWIYVSVPISNRGIYVAIARRTRDLYGGTYLHVGTDLLLPAFMLALAYAALWIATDRLIIRWLTYLRRIALAYSRGHYSIRPIALAAAPSEFKDLGETISVMAGAVEDRDRRLRAALEQKSLLIRETHHRVKNNLQIVMSLLSLQAGKLRDPAAQQALRQAQFRVNALALVHRILYENEDLGAIDLRKMIQDLSRQIHESAGSATRNLRLEFNLVPCRVTSDLAVPLTLFLVEALTNAFRHAFPEQSRGTIDVSLLPVPGAKLRLAIEDDGIGLTPPDDGAGIGSRLIEAFARQVGGSAAVRQREGGGTIVELTFDDPEAEGGPLPPDNPFRSTGRGISPEREERPNAVVSTAVANHVE